MLHLHRAERTPPLVDSLAELLAVPPAEPLTLDVVAVPSQGVERWLAQRLATVLGASSGRDGICAGVAFPSAAALLADTEAAATGVDRRAQPWARPTWELLEVIDASVGQAWCALLTHHLGANSDDGQSEHRRGRRWTTAARLAELFDSYAAERPTMVAEWAAGLDTDGHGQPLPADLVWQAELWRRLRERIGLNPAEHLDNTCAALRAHPETSPLPERVSIFGATRLNTRALAVLDALAAHREVHLWLPHPSPALWTALLGTRATRRATDPTTTTATNPLLRSLGRDVRELQLRLPTTATDTHHPPRPASATSTLLGRLQQDLAHDAAPAAGASPDGTITVHACHGPGRQVEVLRELLLRCFEDDPTLEPRDVLVLCPDIEAFAPLILANFGLEADLPHPGSSLRVRLADRSTRQTNPMLDTVARLLDLAGSRVTATQVLDLAATPGVRRKFSFTDDDLERVRGWVSTSGVRWGLDESTRAAFALGAVPQNTWRTGIDRILMGVTTAEDSPVALGRALPLDDVDSGDVDLTGRLAELLDRVQDVLKALAGEHPAEHWTDTLLGALDALTDTNSEDAWQLGQARRELVAATEGSLGSLRMPDIRALLADRLRGRPTRANFRTGNLTVCTLVPMRAVPHRVVCLLGMDDGVFPRAGGVDGEDVLARDPCVGERDRSSEDRQLLLDAMVSAGEQVLVLHTGADPVTGALRPPAVPVGELLDVLEVMTGEPRADLVTRHPLQPFDPGQFTGANPVSFDPVNLAGAVAAARPRDPDPPRVQLPPHGGPVSLADLASFVEHPVRAYLRQRLQLTLPGEDEAVLDALPIELDALQQWAVGDRLLTAVLAGTPLPDAVRSERLRGTLPPGTLATATLDVVEPRVGALTAAVGPLMAEAPRTVDVRLKLGSVEVYGTVPGIRDGAVVTATYSTLGPKHRARAWVQALALAAAEGAGRAVTVGRGGNRARTSTLVAPSDPLAVLADLVELREAGLREPLPCHPGPSEAYAAAHSNPARARGEAEAKWTGGQFPGVASDAHHIQVWGPDAPFSVWTAEARGSANPTWGSGRGSERWPCGSGDLCWARRPSRESAPRRWPGRVRCLRTVARRDHRPRGQRGNGQDVHHRRSDDPLRRRRGLRP